MSNEDFDGPVFIIAALSVTTMRPATRSRGEDIVKSEHADFNLSA
jgi:hypothetical protein